MGEIVGMPNLNVQIFIRVGHNLIGEGGEAVTHFLPNQSELIQFSASQWWARCVLLNELLLAGEKMRHCLAALADQIMPYSNENLDI